jgi:O6-methylguanine-DNA--protein-cysteine methyltransferase
MEDAQKAILDKYITYEEFAQMAGGPDASRAMAGAIKR